MKIGETLIEETYAEAFGMRYTRLVITADDDYWLDAAVREVTGYGASVIACDVEAGMECRLAPGETPDGRLGAAVPDGLQRIDARLHDVAARRAVDRGDQADAAVVVLGGRIIETIRGEAGGVRAPALDPFGLGVGHGRRPLSGHAAGQTPPVRYQFP